MKKLLLVLGLSVFLVGCGSKSETSYDVSVSNGDEVLISCDEFEITNNEIFYQLLDYYGGNQIVEMALNDIATIEITDQEKIDALLNETLDAYKTYMNNDIESYAISLGYSGEQEYIDDLLLPNVRQTLLKEKYVEENYDELVKKLEVKYIKYITFATESEALEVLDNSTSVEKFDEYLEENSGTDVGFVTNESSIDEEIIGKLSEFTADGLYSKVIKTSSGTYAIVYVYNTDLTDKKEEVTESIAELTSVYNDYKVFYLNKYEFDVYDNKLKEQVSNLIEDLFG